MSQGSSDYEKVLRSLRTNKSLSESNLGAYVTNDLVKNIDDRSLRLALTTLISEDPFRWLELTVRILPQLFDESDETLNVITTLIESTRQDMSFGQVVDVLQGIARDKPKVSQSIARKLSQAENEELVACSGLLIHFENDDRFKDFVDERASKFDGLSGKEKLAALSACLSFLIQRQKFSISEHLKGIVLSSLSDPNLRIRAKGLSTLLACARANPAQVSELLKETASKNGTEARRQISWGLRQPLGDLELTGRVLAICAKDTDAAVLANTAFALYPLAKSQPNLVLQIMRDWIVSGEGYRIYGLEALSFALRDSDTSICYNEVESWIKDDIDPILLMRVPEILFDIFGRNPQDLLKKVESFAEKPNPYFRIWTEIVRLILTGIETKRIADDSLLEYISDLLNRVSTKRKLDVKLIIRGTNKVYGLFLLLEHLRHPPIVANPEKVRSALKLFPNLKNFIGASWFESQIGKGNLSHLLLILLDGSTVDQTKLKQALEELKEAKTDTEKAWSNMKVEGLVWDWALLSHIERLLKSFKRNETGTKHIRDGLQNPDQFYQTLVELELFAMIKTKHQVSPEPSVGSKYLDLSIMLNREILLEAICPEMYKPLRYLADIVGIENMARERIWCGPL